MVVLSSHMQEIFIRKLASGKPVLGVDPNWNGYPSSLRTAYRRLVSMEIIMFDAVSSKLIPCHLCGNVRSPLFGRMSKFTQSHSSMSVLLSN